MLNRQRHTPEAWISQDTGSDGHRAVYPAVVLETCVENAIDSDAEVDDLPDFSVRLTDLDKTVAASNMRYQFFSHVRCRQSNAALRHSLQGGARKAREPNIHALTGQGKALQAVSDANLRIYLVRRDTL